MFVISLWIYKYSIEDQKLRVVSIKSLKTRAQQNKLELDRYYKVCVKEILLLGKSTWWGKRIENKKQNGN